MSERTPDKAEWLDRLERAGQAWESIVTEVGDERMNEPGVMDDWTFKDVAAHLNGWRAWTVARLEAAAAGRTDPIPPWPDGMSEETDESVQEVNDWFYAQNRDRPVADVLAEGREQYRRIQAAVTAIPELVLATPVDWLDGYPPGAVIAGTLEHFHDDHEPGLRAWLAAHPR